MEQVLVVVRLPWFKKMRLKPQEAVGKHYEEIVGYTQASISWSGRWYSRFRLREKDMEAVIFDLDGLLAEAAHEKRN